MSIERKTGSTQKPWESPALFLIVGPCVIESEAHARMMAERVAKIGGMQRTEPLPLQAHLLRTRPQR